MEHIRRIAQQLPRFQIDAMLISSVPGEFYTAGLHGEGYVVVTADAACYITDSRYFRAAQAELTNCQILCTTRAHRHLALVRDFLETHQVKTLGIEENYLTLAKYEELKKALPSKLVPAGKLVTDLRARKDQDELARMVGAQQITDDAFTEILGYLRPGLTEQEIAARLVYEMLRRGAQRTSFDPIVASGPNGGLPPAPPTQRQVQAGEFITMDFGCIYGGYCSDMTRTVALGHINEDKRRVYDTVLAAQLAGIAVSRAGITGAEIHAAAGQVIQAAGYGRFFTHSYGHSLGIEIHEAPYANPKDHTPMPVGAMVSAEPGIYIPGQFGVRIEDVVRMEADGCTVITLSPKDLIIL